MCKWRTFFTHHFKMAEFKDFISLELASLSNNLNQEKVILIVSGWFIIDKKRKRALSSF